MKAEGFRKDESGRMKDELGKPEDLRTRTKRFALRVIRLYSALPKKTEAQVIGKQLLRSGTSVGAHYREAVRNSLHRASRYNRPDMVSTMVVLWTRTVRQVDSRRRLDGL